MTATVRDAALAYGTLATEFISPAVRQRFRLPEVEVADHERESPDDAAAFVRSQWQLGNGPVGNLVHILESKGVEIYWLDEESGKVDAFSFWLDDRPFVFLNARVVAGSRARFSLAHELGHLVLHRNTLYERLHNQDWRLTEGEADSFAAAFLLPRNEFIATCPRYPVLTQFLPAKQHWRVAVQAMIRRAHDVGVYDDRQYRQAYIEISRQGWRKQEPGEFLAEESQLHRLVFEGLREQGTSASAFAESIGLSLADVAALVPAAAENVGTDSESPGEPRREQRGTASRGGLRRVK